MLVEKKRNRPTPKKERKPAVELVRLRIVSLILEKRRGKGEKYCKETELAQRGRSEGRT